MPLKTPADPQLTESLVAANHILVRREVLDAFGHVSARTAPGADTFLLSRSLAPASVTSSDLLVHGLDGGVDDDRAPYLERFIHSEIYRRRPDVMAVVHSHGAAVIPFSITDVALRPVFHMAAFLDVAGPPVYEINEHAGDSSDLLVGSMRLGRSLAATLGDGAVALMRGHGSVTVGSSLQEAVFRAVYLEVNAHIQLQTLALGMPHYLSAGEARSAGASISSQVRRSWDVWSHEVQSMRSENR